MIAWLMMVDDDWCLMIDVPDMIWTGVCGVKEDETSREERESRTHVKNMKVWQICMKQRAGGWGWQVALTFAGLYPQ